MTQPLSPRSGSASAFEERPAQPPRDARAESDIAEVERKRIGREFHDGLGQKLTSVSVAASILVEKLSEKNLPEADDARRLLRMVRETVRDARNLARGLNPAALLNKGLENAVEELLTQVRETASIRTSLDIRNWHPIDDENAALHVFRIIQEAVNNAVKHSGCSRISVLLKTVDDHAVVEVIDDGCGIVADRDESSGMGMALMEQRADALGGSLDIDSQAGEGSAVRCIFERAPKE